MPFYEYECSNCKFYVEALQKLSDPSLKKCPSCGKETLQRLISAPVFRLKGAGWYETDFKSDKENKRNLADDKEPAAVADSDDKKVTVRARKATKPTAKAATKTAAKKVVKKAADKPTPAKPIAKATKRPVAKRSAKKAPPSKKSPSKKSAKKLAKKKPVAKVAKKKAAGNKVARKK